MVWDEAQLETSSVRVRDAAVSSAERGPSAPASFSAIGHGSRVVELKMHPVPFVMGVDGEFDGIVGYGCLGWSGGCCGF